MTSEPSSQRPASQRPVLTIDITADPICGFSYIACLQLERALRSYIESNGPVDARTRVHPYILDPNLPEDCTVARLDCFTRDFGEAGLAFWETVQEAGKPYDIRFSRDYVGQSIDSQRLLVLALRKLGPAAQYRLLQILFYQHHRLTHEITNPNFLAKIACCPLVTHNGVTRGLFETEPQALQWIRSTELRTEVLSAGKQARDKGVMGSPFIVINGTYAVCGAQGESAFRSVIERALRAL